MTFFRLSLSCSEYDGKSLPRRISNQFLKFLASVISNIDLQLTGYSSEIGHHLPFPTALR